MKGKSLLKKIGAVATTVAMIASVGATAFAANVEYTGGAQVIMGVETGTGTGIYKVEVPYKSSVANTIGVTMLSYSAGNSDVNIDEKPAYGSDATETAMQIVGVDQINAGDASNAIGADGIGKFTFYVDTNAGATTDAIRMEKGERGVVLLSGDAATGANGYLFQVGKAAGIVKVYINTAESTELEAEGYPAAEQTGADYVKSVITTGMNSVKLNADVVAADKVTVTAKGADYDKNNWQAQNVTYTVSVDDAAYDVTAAELTVTYAANTLTATGVEVANVTVAKDDIQNGDLEAAVEAAITSVTLKDATNSKVVTVDADDIEVTIADSYVESDEEAVYTATVKVLEGQYDRFVVEEAGVSANNVQVTVSVTKWDIAAIALVEGTEATLAAGEVAYESAPANEEAILAAVKTAYENKVVAKSADGKSGAVAADKVTVTKKDGSYSKETKTAQTLTYTIGIADGTAVSGSNAIADASALKIDVTYTITVTGHPAPAYACGDVNHDNKVNNKDAVYIMQYGDGLLDEEESNEIKNNRTFEADTFKDSRINNKDAVAIMNFVDGNYDSLPVQ